MTVQNLKYANQYQQVFSPKNYQKQGLMDAAEMAMQINNPHKRSRSRLESSPNKSINGSYRNENSSMMVSRVYEPTEEDQLRELPLAYRNPRNNQVSQQSTVRSELDPNFEKIFTDTDLGIFIQVFRFLEGNHLIGPSLETFKLAMLNKKMYNFVMMTYDVNDFSDFAILYAKQQVLRYLEAEPVLEKFSFDQNATSLITSAFRSEVFGGSVCRGVLSPDLTAEKPNMLNDLIIQIPIDFKSGGQFYELRNVKDKQGRFFDYFILVDGGITKKQSIKSL